MNFDSRILKLSVLIMLVLVFLPVIAAEDSSEAFFVEYSYESDEAFVVEEYDPIDLAQEQVSLSHEIEEEYNEYNKDVPVLDQSGEIANNPIITHEEIKSPVAETNNVPNDGVNTVDDINKDDKIGVFDTTNVNVNHNDVDEDVDLEAAAENNSIIRHGSVIFISEEVNENEYVRLINDLFTETTNYETHSFKRSLIKVLELKNNLLINRDVSFIFSDDFMADLNGDLIECTDKITTDFAFSIDNSIVGSDNLVIFVSSSFCSDFIPCFYAFVCCNLLDFKSFFGDNNIFLCCHNSIFNII
ncbi:hypothetical protein [Methanobrevibacter sp.]|uniref:hypothetical protein n=1 Tax=Methanobrevibacter sp. TaxID=66852 RepID=UPI0038908B44